MAGTCVPDREGWMYACMKLKPIAAGNRLHTGHHLPPAEPRPERCDEHQRRHLHTHHQPLIQALGTSAG